MSYLLRLLERTHLDLAHTLARYAELGGEILERDRIVGEAARLEDAPLAFIQHVQRADERVVTVVALLAVGEDALLRRRVVDQPVLPLSRLAIVADRRVERGVAAKTAVHIDDVPLGHAEALGDDLHLIGAETALFERRDLALRLAQVEEQLLLVRGGAHLHERPRAQDVLLDRGLDPPHGICREPETLL